MIRASLFALALACAACAPPADTSTTATTTTTDTSASAMPQTREEATQRDTCGGAQYRSMIGQQVAAITVPVGVRVIMPDTVVTQDFRPDRVNLIADASGRVTSVECY